MFRISALSISFKHFTYKYNTSLLSIPIITFFFNVYNLGLFSPLNEFQVLSDCVDGSAALRAGAYRRSRNVNGVKY